MGLVLEIPPWPALPALLKVVGIGLGHLGAALLDPGQQLFGRLWQVAVGGFYQGQLIVQVFTRQFGGVLGFAMQLLVHLLMAALGRMGERGRLARQRCKECHDGSFRKVRYNGPPTRWPRKSAQHHAPLKCRASGCAGAFC